VITCEPLTGSERSSRNTLSSVCSPFIVYLHGTYADKRHLYFFLEYLPGGELFTRIYKTKGMKVCVCAECVWFTRKRIDSYCVRCRRPSSIRLRSCWRSSSCTSE
jgi:hypothetical protein